MARAAAKGRQRSKPAPRDAPKRTGRRQLSTAEQNLFFSRIRRQAKWAFAFLAVIFAVTFAFLGVGSGTSGLQDLFNGINPFGGGSSTISISDAQKEVAEHPNSAKAYRDLATAFEQKSQNDEAITALEQYTTMRPKNASALAELAALQLSHASTLRDQYASIAAEQQAASPQFGPTQGSKLAQGVGQDAIQGAISSEIDQRASAAYTNLSTAYNSALATYQKLAKVRSKDPSTQLELAQAAESAGQTAIAIKAYQRFLVLAPDDTNAAAVRDRLKQLQPAPQKKSSG
jgi:tetratricopeptide (TPR) repeat protein